MDLRRRFSLAPLGTAVLLTLAAPGAQGQAEPAPPVAGTHEGAKAFESLVLATRGARAAAKAISDQVDDAMKSGAGTCQQPCRKDGVVVMVTTLGDTGQRIAAYHGLRMQLDAVMARLDSVKDDVEGLEIPKRPTCTSSPQEWFLQGDVAATETVGEAATNGTQRLTEKITDVAGLVGSIAALAQSFIPQVKVTAQDVGVPAVFLAGLVAKDLLACGRHVRDPSLHPGSLDPDSKLHADLKAIQKTRETIKTILAEKAERAVIERAYVESECKNATQKAKALAALLRFDGQLTSVASAWKDADKALLDFLDSLMKWTEGKPSTMGNLVQAEALARADWIVQIGEVKAGGAVRVKNSAWMPARISYSGGVVVTFALVDACGDIHAADTLTVYEPFQRAPKESREPEAWSRGHVEGRTWR